MKKITILVMILVSLCIPTVVFADEPSTDIDITLTTDGDINADINLDAEGDTNLTINGVEPFTTVHEYSYSSYVSIYDDTALKATIAALQELLSILQASSSQTTGDIAVIVESVTNLIRDAQSTDDALSQMNNLITKLQEADSTLKKMDSTLEEVDKLNKRDILSTLAAARDALQKSLNGLELCLEENRQADAANLSALQSNDKIIQDTLLEESGYRYTDDKSQRDDISALSKGLIAVAVVALLELLGLLWVILRKSRVA